MASELDVKRAQAAIAKAQSSGRKTSKKDQLADRRLNVKIFTPYQTYYQGEAVSVSANNKTGPFDVLFAHANFFSLLTAGNVVVETGYASLSFPLDRGVIKVTNNLVTIFVDV